MFHHMYDAVIITQFQGRSQKKLMTEAMSMEDLWLRQSVHGWVLFLGIKSVYSDKTRKVKEITEASASVGLLLATAVNSPIVTLAIHSWFCIELASQLGILTMSQSLQCLCLISLRIHRLSFAPATTCETRRQTSLFARNSGSEWETAVFAG